MASFSYSTGKSARKFQSPPSYKPQAAEVNSKQMEEEREKRRQMMESLGISSGSDSDSQSTSSSSSEESSSSRRSASENYCLCISTQLTQKYIYYKYCMDTHTPHTRSPLCPKSIFGPIIRGKGASFGERSWR